MRWPGRAALLSGVLAVALGVPGAVCGVLANRPDNLVRWIVNSRAISPKTAMPITGISEQHTRHVAAYLLTLR